MFILLLERLTIYTSYYNKILSFDRSKYYLVQISTSAPKFAVPHLHQRLEWLMPGFDLVNKIKSGIINQDEYTKEYLSKITWEEYSALEQIAKSVSKFGRSLVLFCWESPDKFCHRHLLATEFNKRSKSVKIEEYNFEKSG